MAHQISNSWPFPHWWVMCPLSAWLFCCSNAFSWSSAGHIVIAAEAWHEFSPGFRSKVFEVLKSHPAFEQWKESFGQGNVEFSEYIFMRASTWPDEIRRHHSKFDHPHWHYINYPLKPPHFPMEPSPLPEDALSLALINARKSSPIQKLRP